MEMGQVQGFTIASGASLSNALLIDGADRMSIVIQTGATTAALTFQASHDGVKFYELKDSAGAAVTVTGAASASCFSLSQGHLTQNVKFMKIRSGTAGTAQVQTAGMVGSVYRRWS